MSLTPALIKKTDSAIFQTSLFLLSTMTVLGGAIISPSLPDLEKHFSYVPHIDLLSKLILTLPALFIMIMAPFVGILLDKYGRLKFIFPAMAIWSISGGIGYFLNDIYSLLISRAVLGISTSFVMDGVSVLLSDYFQGSRREKALSKQGFFRSFGGAIMLIIGGYLAHLNWHFPFLVYFLGLFILAFATLNLFEVKYEHHTHKHVSDKKSGFRFLTFAPVYALTLINMVMYYTIPTQLPFFIVDILHEKPGRVGESMAMSAFAMAFIALFYARLRRIFGIYILYSISFFFMLTGFLLISLIHSYPVLLLALVLSGIGIGIMLVNNSSWLFSLAEEKIKARAYGFLSSFLFMGQFISPFFSEPLVKYLGLSNMFLVTALIALVGMVIFIVVAIKSKVLKERMQS
ncbi:MFS transporter [Helicobacter sp. 13S00401-1]|uniref:MFS transporter n=1 Tax=Helicobacter sp. 13S00401-1 TaxID=1905758 RepID=UPI000BA51B99|nr:MFS transporter [Helicobacter sp. 13S00401-1]PAF50933.1 MFS transporter [Helicobacter sp. 13S00401-1]